MKIKRIELLHTCNKLYRLFASFGIRDDSLEKVSKIIPETLFRWVSCEGHPGLKRFKVMSNSLIRQILGLKAEFPFSSKYKRIRLRILLSSRKSKLHSIYWISVLSLFRLIKLEPVEDTSTITDSFKGSLLGLIFNMRSLYHASKSFSRRLKSPLENWTCHWKWHISAAAGPNGTVAYTRFLHDLYASRKEGVLIKSLFLLYVLPVCNKQEAFDSLKDAIFQSFTDENIAKDDPIHSRLAFLSDSGGKTRIIALVDILSQSVLKLIHQRVNSLLRKLSSDGTFDQDAQRKRVQEWTNSKWVIYSIDLSAATDRLPVIYQLLVIIFARILTPLQAIGWLLLLVHRTFTYKTGGVRKHVRYTVGQPMGALSSWPVMAISHHVLIWWSSQLAYPDRDFDPSSEYAILGDDLVIANSAIAEKYLELIKLLGVDFSPEKTIIREGLAEFAKSLFRRGEDLSPFPSAPLIFDINTVVSNVLAVLTTCSDRKFRTDLSTIMGLYPWRVWKQVELASLSATSPKYVLDVKPRTDFGIFFSILLQTRIRYFNSIDTVWNSTHAFAINDPGKSGKRLSSPYLQIGSDNSNSYPVRMLDDKTQNLSSNIMLGKGWIAYDSRAWSNGLPTIGDKRLIPGPQHDKIKDDFWYRSSLLRLERLLPGYFTLRCVGPQVGE